MKFIFIFFFLGPANSTPAYRVPSLQKLTATSGFQVEKNLKVDTTVVSGDYQVEIPRGWTMKFTGETKELKSDFSAFANDTFDSPYSFGISETKKPLDLASIKKKQIEKGRAVKKLKTPNSEGVSVEYQADTQSVIVQYVRSKEKSFVVMALYPVKNLEKDREKKQRVVKIVNSLKFN